MDITLGKEMTELVRNHKALGLNVSQGNKVDSYVGVTEKEHKSHPLMYLVIPSTGK